MEVKVESYYLIETNNVCFGGYDSYEEVLKFAQIEKEQHPNDTVKIIHQTTVTTDLGEI